MGVSLSAASGRYAPFGVLAILTNTQGLFCFVVWRQLWQSEAVFFGVSWRFQERIMSNNSNQEPVSVGSWIGFFILLAIPLVNIIVIIAGAVSSTNNPSKRSYCRALILWLVLCMIGGVVCAFVFGAALSSVFKSSDINLDIFKDGIEQVEKIDVNDIDIDSLEKKLERADGSQQAPSADKPEEKK